MFSIRNSVSAAAIIVAAHGTAQAVCPTTAHNFGPANDTVTLAAASVNDGTYTFGNGSDVMTVATGADISCVTLFDGGDDTASADTFTDALTLNGQTLNMSYAGGAFINWERIILDASTLDLVDGTLTVGVDSGNGILIRNNSRLSTNLAAAITGNVIIDATSTLKFKATAAANSVIGAVTNSGTIDLRNTSAGDSLAITGNYSGTGTIALDVDLSGSTLTSDTVTITGNASGAGRINLNAIGSPSAGPSTGNGLRLITVTGTDTATFSLVPSSASSGLYDFSLSKADGQNWYLQSTVRDIVSGAGIISDTFEDMSLLYLGTLNDRRASAEGSDKAVWVRSFGRMQNQTYQGTATGELSSNGTHVGLEIGSDIYHVATAAGHFNLGLNAGFSSLNGEGGASDVTAHGILTGASATFTGNSGLYVDAVIQGNWLTGQVATSSFDQIDTSSIGGLMSLEAGHKFKLGSSFALTPQAQLIYSATAVGDATDLSGHSFEFNTQHTALTRAGLRMEAGHDFSADGDGSGLATGWLKANLWHNLSEGGPTFSASGAEAKLSEKQNWIELGAGASSNLTPSITAFADADASFGLDEFYTAFTAKAGFSSSW